MLSNQIVIIDEIDDKEKKKIFKQILTLLKFYQKNYIHDEQNEMFLCYLSETAILYFIHFDEHVDIGNLFLNLKYDKTKYNLLKFHLEKLTFHYYSILMKKYNMICECRTLNEKECEMLSNAIDFMMKCFKNTSLSYVATSVRNLFENKHKT
jgi:hypothetical protein